ncbi:MAG: glycosyl transferase family 2 [Acidobacteria bacterium]|nr:glycosyl transferase family 2 [Acidobacteriota bacterium]
MKQEPEIAVLIPCHNEEVTIGKVIEDFRAQLPDATVYVFDNCSTDRTAAVAREHGVRIITEPRRGKGYVVDSMFDRVKADLYVLVDGDDTYSAGHVHELLEPVRTGSADMAVGARLAEFADKSFRPLHVFGNRLVVGLINRIFHTRLTDIMSGYRAFHRRVVQRIPVVSSGFEVETEMTIQMLYYRLKIIEIPLPYRSRPGGSVSKLRTLPDGLRVLWKIFSLFRNFKPLTFFGGIGLFVFLLGISAGIPPIYGFIESGYTEVRRFPLAILATGLVLLSAILVLLGLILHAVNWRIKELHNVLTRSGNGIQRD